MAVQRILIHEFLEKSNAGLVFDVRSPAEYTHAHIPGAISLPLFTDEERKIVGTLYKQKSREAAIKAGLDFFGPKMKSMVETVEAYCEQIKKEGKPTVFLYCWRGGMRSGAVSWLLDLYGFKVYTLSGGYKSFRNHVLQSFNQSYSFKILGGFTGSGKTEVLKELEKQGQPVIDLEALASHKGSAFGKHKMPPQPTQEMFENLLSTALRKFSNHSTERPVWLEDESQRIGDVNIPKSLWTIMRNSPVIFLEIPFEERLNHIVEEYGDYPKEKLISGIERISKRLGPQHAKAAIGLLDEGNIKEAFRILLLYYDKRYLKGLHSRENLSALLTRFPCEKVDSLNARILTKHQSV